MPAKQLDEFSASLAEAGYNDFSIYYTDGVGGKSVSPLILLGKKIFENFNYLYNDRPLTKYRYAEAYLRLYDYLVSIEDQTQSRDKDGALLESFTDWGADPEHPGSIKISTKYRPWASNRPKTVTDIEPFNKSNLKKAREYLLHTNPGAILYEEPEEERQPATVKQNGNNAWIPPASEENGDEPDQRQFKPEIEGLSVKYRATPRLIQLLTNPKYYNYDEIRIEDLALAIRAISQKKIKPQDARDIAAAYISKYIDSKTGHTDKLNRNYDKIRDEIVSIQQFYQGGDKPVDPDSDTEVFIPFFFSGFSVLNLYYEYHVDIGQDIVKQFNGELKKELNEMYQLDKIDVSLQKYFQTQTRADFAEVIHNTAQSRYLMALYLEDDFNDDASKRTTFFRLWESAVLDNEFPSEYKSFFAGIAGKIKEIHALVNKDALEEAIKKNREVYVQFLEVKQKLQSYEQDKMKWGNRALFLITLAIDLLISYLTAGLTRLIPSRAGLLLNLLIPAIKQELYLKVGLIEKRDFVNLGVEAVVNTAASKIATSISVKLVSAYNIPLGRFRSIVMDTLLVNFLNAFQTEVIASIRSHKDLDDFLMDLLKNFVTGLAHEKCARIAIGRARKDGLDELVRRQDPSIMAEPARPVNNRLSERPVPEVSPPSTHEVTTGKSSVSAPASSKPVSDIQTGGKPNDATRGLLSPLGKGNGHEPVRSTSETIAAPVASKGAGDSQASEGVTTKLTEDGSVLRRRGREKTKAPAKEDQTNRHADETDDSDIDISRKQLENRGQGDKIDTVDDEDSVSPGVIAPPEQEKKGRKEFTAQPKFNPQTVNWDPRATSSKGITPRIAYPSAPFHHLIPQELVNDYPKIRALLKKRGIDIDQFTVKITQGYHMATHRLDYNGEWIAFFKKNPNATRKEILDFKDSMKQKFKLDEFPETPYGIDPPDAPE